MLPLLGLAFPIAIVVAFVLVFLRLITLRVVVPTNDIHIVQSARRTISYGKDQAAGNVYYRWPGSIPRFGVSVSVLPVSVFSQTLTDYNAYDKGRVPFMLDVIGFFRVKDSNLAAQRITDMKSMREQLDFILKGSIRSILATSEIEQILEGRSEFGHQFTEAVDGQLAEWGLQTVKALEIMDIRDVKDGHVIENIMNKQKSRIEMESRTTVAANMQAAQTAEIAAKREVALADQQAAETVGVRTAEKAQTIGIRDQQAQQAIQEQAKETKTREMAVLEVNNVRTADIARQAAEIAATRDKNVTILQSEAEKQTKILNAEGDLEVALKKAQGVEAEGKAAGAASEASLMAPVTAQIAFAKEVGSNAEYQNYLVTLKQIEAAQSVGEKQAAAMSTAQIKIISTAGTPLGGVKSVGDIFSPAGALNFGAALEAFKESGVGKAILDKLTSDRVDHDDKGE